jgi:linoleoyl-CoA desaturase
MILNPIGAVLICFAIASSVLGVVLAVTFQLAHCVDEAGFPKPPADGSMEIGWYEHQVRTTVDFARKNPFVTWYLGGLNFQVEHHLFPKICHVHYPAISEIVESTCKEFGVPYFAHRTVRSALKSHVKLLNKLGKRVEPGEPLAA